MAFSRLIACFYALWNDKESMMKRIIVLLTAAVLIALVWFFALSLNAPKISNVKTQEGKSLPSGFELLKLNGEKVNETELNNGIVLLNVWASW